MSTSRSTWSGMTLVFVPPCATVGANVVCVHACQCRAIPSGQFGESAVEPGGIEERGRHFGVEVHPLHELTPRLVDLRLGPVLGDASHDLGRGHERVVGVERLRSVSGRPVHADLGPERALLPHQHGEPRSGRRRDLEAARLREHVVGVHRVALVVEQPVGTPGAERLFVGDREVDQRALGPEPTVGESAEGNRLRGGEVEHVDRAVDPRRSRRPRRLRTGRDSSRRGSRARRRCGPSASASARRDPFLRFSPPGSGGRAAARRSRGRPRRRDNRRAGRRCGSPPPTRPCRR